MKSEMLIPVGLIGSLALLLHWVPLWRRENLWFGVTVAPGFRDSPEGRRVLLRYRGEVWALALIAAAWSVWAVRVAADWVLPAAMLLISIGPCVSFALAQRRVRRFALPELPVRSASLSPAEEEVPGGAASVLVPFAILAAAGLYLRAHWQNIPERFPVHWGLAGQPDRWAARSWHAAYAPLIVGALLVAVMLLLGRAILRSSPRGRIPETAAWTARFRRVNLRLIVTVTYTLAFLLAATSLTPLFGSRFASLMWIPVVVMIVSILPFAWQMVRLSQQPGSRTDGTPDECWTFGQIYFNRNDPALMVERRFGIGYTLNFGHPASWWLAGLLIVIIATGTFL